MEQAEQTPPATKRPTTVNDIPDHLLKLIFRHLGSHVYFLRAAAVCTRWRRIVSTRGIKYRDCNYHDFSTTMGHYHVLDPSLSPAQAQRHRYRVAFIPSSPSIDAGHLSLDFLPNGPCGRPWRLVDGYGSLLLLATQRRTFLPYLIVCEPISRRFVKIKPIEEDMKYSHCLGVFLDRGYYVRSISSFSVTCVVHERSMGITNDSLSFVMAKVYTHQPPWCRRLRHGWSSPRRARSGGIHVHGVESAHYAGRSKGYIFWTIQDDCSVFSAREGSGELSHFRLPENVRTSHDTSTFRFVDDGGNDGLVRLVSLIGHELRVFLKKEHNNGGSEWVIVRSLNLAEATIGLPGYRESLFSGTVKIVTAGKGYVVLTPAKETWLFSVELGTMQVEREHLRNRHVGEVYPYELRLRPKVRACVFPCKKGREGPCYHICRCK
ncbi:hypothetical protein HU200_029025 [Digitaria exilis]|uniref:F-box domain-containing protein n=1 Tax=Digitaria exilis TaxID=1010633 RepID=A0A835BU15_9POAL|nr:hypothetical protein HU200_029025 [Digitaria exilis]